MSQHAAQHATQAIIGEPEVVEDGATAQSPAWLALKSAVSEIRELQIKDGSIPDAANHARAAELVGEITARIQELAPLFPHDAEYLRASVADFERWAADGFGVPDFLDSLVAFHPEQHRVDGLRHLVVFPMYTQNGSSDRLVEAVLIEVIWPEFVAELEAGDYSNKLFVPVRFVDFTAGYDTNAAVLFPETVAMREIPTFTWGAIFADREAARFRRVVRAASEITGLDLPADARELLDDQELTEETFVMWDLIHDRTHMRGDLPFDPFMIKQRMPYFLYSLEELRCDLTAFRESVRLVRAEDTDPVTRKHAQLVQYTVIFDRIFRFALTGSRVRNYDGLGGQLLFAWMHQHHVLHWTDTTLSHRLGRGSGRRERARRGDRRPLLALHRPAEGRALARRVRAGLGDARRRIRHRSGPAAWTTRRSPDRPRGYTDQVLDDEFPLSMFYEALQKKMADVIESTSGITGAADLHPRASLLTARPLKRRAVDNARRGCGVEARRLRREADVTPPAPR